VRIDAVHNEADLADVGERACTAERTGAAGFFVPEARHDPFLALTIAADRTETVELGTSVAIAFARNPMNLAQLGDDLHRFSGGRFVLGLGTQIRPHVTRRFGMPWSHPAPRMRELVLAVRAIWACWHNGQPLDFTGDFYTHTLMTPVFDPGPSSFGSPTVWLAAVGERLGEVAGEVADGLITHPLTTQAYLDAVLLPALARGAAQAGVDPEAREVAGMAMVATGESDEAIDAAADIVRIQIAFYGSTPAYRPLLDAIGRGDLQPQLRDLSTQGRWDEMTALVDDDLLHALAVVGTPSDVATGLRARYAGWDRVSLGLLSPVSEDVVADIIRQAQA